MKVRANKVLSTQSFLLWRSIQPGKWKNHFPGCIDRYYLTDPFEEKII